MNVIPVNDEILETLSKMLNIDCIKGMKEYLEGKDTYESRATIIAIDLCTMTHNDLAKFGIYLSSLTGYEIYDTKTLIDYLAKTLTAEDLKKTIKVRTPQVD